MQKKNKKTTVEEQNQNEKETENESKSERETRQKEKKKRRKKNKKTSLFQLCAVKEKRGNNRMKMGMCIRQYGFDGYTTFIVYISSYTYIFRERKVCKLLRTVDALVFVCFRCYDVSMLFTLIFVSNCI